MVWGATLRITSFTWDLKIRKGKKTSSDTSSYLQNTQVYCAEKTGKKTYEDFAEAAFRTKKARSVISCFSIVALLGFTTAYISLAKTLIPSIIAASIGDVTGFKY